MVRLLVALVLVTGCRNPCQQVCVELRDYAEECGFVVADTEFTSCLEAQKKPEDADKEFCRDYGDSTTIREEWGCEDLADYWLTGGSGETTTDTAGT